MALNRILLPVLMIASTTAVLLNDANEDTHQSMVAEVSTLKSQMQSLHQENAGLKLRVQIKDLQAEVATLRRGNSMLQRQGKVLVGGVQEGDWVWVADHYPMLPYLQVFGQSASQRNDRIEAWNGFLLPGTIGKIVKFGPFESGKNQDQWVEPPEGKRYTNINGNIDLEEGDAGVYWLNEGTNQGEDPEEAVLSQAGAVKLTLLEKHVTKLKKGDRITVNEAVLKKSGGGLQKISNDQGISFKSGVEDTAAAGEAEEECWEDGGFKLMTTPEETDPDGILLEESLSFWNVECGGKIYAFESAWISAAYTEES